MLSECVIAVVGHPWRTDDRSPEERVIARVGLRGLDVLSTAKSIVDSVYSADPPLWNFRDPGAVSNAARQFLQARHPELSPEAVAAIVNKFTYDWK